jgi:CheY-like chemotaxis protein
VDSTEPEDAGGASLAAADDASGDGGEWLHVLLVDDCADTREMYAEFLQSSFRVETAGTGESALARLQVRAPDVVVMDLSLSDMRGEQVIDGIRQSPAMRDVRVVVLSGFDEPPRRTAAWDAYLTKPCAPDALVSCIRKLLSGDTRAVRSAS